MLPTNKEYAGAMMVLPHIVRETWLRIESQHSLGDPEAEKIFNNLQTLTESIYGVAKSQTDYRHGGKVMLHSHERNHTTYSGFDGCLSFAKMAATEIMQHCCVIGEITMRLLTDLIFYLALIGERGREVDAELRQMAAKIHEITETLL